MELPKYTKEQQANRAKQILKVLRKEWVRCGLIKANGTTTPTNPKDYPVYFAISSNTRWNNQDRRNNLFLNFKESEGMTIKAALDKHNLKYNWDGNNYACFEFDLDKPFLNPTE